MRMSEEPISFNSKDLCMIEHIPELIECGDRQFQDRRADEDSPLCGDGCENLSQGDRRLSGIPRKNTMPIPAMVSRSRSANCTYRQFTTGFFFGKPAEEVTDL